MIVDVSLKNAKFYDVQAKFDIVKGEKFSLFTDAKDAVIFATTNDSVLSLTESDTSFQAVADNVGTSKIIIFNAGMEIQKTIEINVVPAIVDPAVQLNATADAPIPKSL